jgi:hypothetical protein
LVVPIGEQPDEFAHWQVAAYIHEHAHLPTLDPHMDQWFQMPLYYVLISPLASSLDWPALSYDSLPPKLYDRTGLDFEKYRPARITRLLTILLAMLGVVFCYYTALEVTASYQAGILAAGLMALLPQFTFRSAAVSNDALATSLAAASLYFATRLVTRRELTWTLAYLSGAAMGLAFITKMHTIFLPAVWVFAALLSGLIRSHYRQAAAALGVWVFIAAGPLVRNYVLYRDIFLIRTEALVAAPYRTDHPLFSAYFIDMFPRWLARSFVGWFGWMNLSSPQWVYDAFAWLLMLSVCGYIGLVAARKVNGRVTMVFLVAIGLNVMIVVTANMTFTQPQGRYMFPTLSVICVLCAMGLRGIPRLRTAMGYAVLGGMLFINVDLLVGVVHPAYWNDDVPQINADPSLPMIGFIDAPRNGQVLHGNSVGVGGWILWGEGVRSISVFVDGSRNGTRAHINIPRPDVKNVHPEYQNLYSGWGANLDLQQLSPGQHKISIQVTSKWSGAVKELATLAITVARP